MMIMMKKVFAVAAAGAALATIVGLAAAGVGAAHAMETAGARSYASQQAISYSFGSKRAVGYFAAQNGTCALTMFLAEAEDGYIAPSAARIKFTVKPGESAELSSVEGQNLEVKCGKDAAAVEVRQTGLTTAAVTTN
jgi:hypothetical protein